MTFKYEDNRECMETLYTRKGLDYSEDHDYLESAFNEVNKLWIDNLKKIKTVKYIMIAEAPLWGSHKTYIYNPKSIKNTQFFYRSDLEVALGKKGKIKNKADFILKLNEIGLVIIEISPFALNSVDTQVNYGRTEKGSKKITEKEYQELVGRTLTTYFEKKLELIKHKSAENVEVFFRYKRVQEAFQSLIEPFFIKSGLLKKGKILMNISRKGGGIDRVKLKGIINPGL